MAPSLLWTCASELSQTSVTFVKSFIQKVGRWVRTICIKPLCWVIWPRPGLDMPGHCSQDCFQLGNCEFELRGEKFESCPGLCCFPPVLHPSADSPGAYMILSHLVVVTGPSYSERNYLTQIDWKIKFSLNACCRQWGDRTRDIPSDSSTSLRYL